MKPNLGAFYIEEKALVACLHRCHNWRPLLAPACTCVHELEAALEALPVNLNHVREALRVLQCGVGVSYTRVYTQQLNITP